MTSEISKVIDAVKSGRYSFCKFISPNDAGETGAHQGGLYIPKNSIALLFDEPGRKGENKEKMARITWDDGTTSDCRFIYYGKGSRNEYRITRLGRHFKVGEFVVIVKNSEEDYTGFVISQSSDINDFLDEFDLRPEDTNNLIDLSDIRTQSLQLDLKTGITPANNELEVLSEYADFNFKPRAGIIKIIGQELISNDVIALVELIKNSYDADSLNIEIELNNIFSESGEIIIKDDGLGMSYEKIVNVWLEPATPDKKSKSEKKYSQCFQRRLLGEKGIGRFAAHRLGDYIELITRARLGCGELPLKYETSVKIDWTAFTEDKYLDEIPVTIKKIHDPSVFIGQSGTSIKITNIHPWKNAKAVKDAVIKIKGLESPVTPKKLVYHKSGGTADPGVKIQISSNDISLNTELNNLKSLKDVLETAFYKFSAIIDSNGQILYDYSFDRPDYQDIKRVVTSGTADLKSYDLEWFEEHPLSIYNDPGTFEVSFYAWDLEAASLRVAGLADYYRNIIKPNSGVRIYRDNFRVWPYGEPDNDWLELDLSRLNAPKERTVSRNQIFGVVHISSVQNPRLQDQSNREGLIVNPHYEHFYHLVDASLNLFAKERKADKVRLDKVTRNKEAKDELSRQIDGLRDKIETNNHASLYKADVDAIEQTYRTKINDVLERYMMAAAIGISYSLPIHEMRLRLTSIKHVIEDIERNAHLEDKYLRELSKQLSDTEDIVRAVSSIMSRQKKQKVNLYKSANNARVLKETDLVKYNIIYEITGDKELDVEAVPGLLNTAILNLLDNAIYWLRVRKNDARQKAEEFQAHITVNISKNSQGQPCITFADNGHGFQDDFELLVEPYYSTRNDGLGLGLYLVSEIMIRFGGRVRGYNNNGATVELIFQS